jgi:uncharacterized protein DUF4164
MSTEAAVSEGAIELAARRLERALSLLEQRLAKRVAQASAGAGAELEADRASLAAALDESRARERELEEAGAAASAALAKAIAEIRATLGETRANGEAACETTDAEARQEA